MLNRLLTCKQKISTNEQVLKQNFINITCGQIMHTEQVQNAPFKMNVTRSQVVRAERALQSQLHMIIICNEAYETILDHDFS